MTRPKEKQDGRVLPRCSGFALWLARPLSALPPGIAEQVHEIRLRVGCGVQLTIGGKPCCPAERPALQMLRLTPLQMEEIFVHPLRRVGTQPRDRNCGGLCHAQLWVPRRVGRAVLLRTGAERRLAGAGRCKSPRCPEPGISSATETPGYSAAAIYRDAPMGNPDSGKTTLLRGVARELAKQNRAVAVIDERREIFPSEESAALPLDILSGIPKGQAVQMALRTLSPQVILLDELGGLEETMALEQGFFSGVEFIATLHAATPEEATLRPQVQYLHKARRECECSSGNGRHCAGASERCDFVNPLRWCVCCFGRLRLVRRRRLSSEDAAHLAALRKTLLS